MSEQKYCVMKKSNFMFLCKTKNARLKWKSDNYYSNSCPEFTKLELEKIKSSRLYKRIFHETETIPLEEVITYE